MSDDCKDIRTVIQPLPEIQDTDNKNNPDDTLQFKKYFHIDFNADGIRVGRIDFITQNQELYNIFNSVGLNKSMLEKCKVTYDAKTQLLKFKLWTDISHTIPVQSVSEQKNDTVQYPVKTMSLWISYDDNPELIINLSPIAGVLFAPGTYCGQLSSGAKTLVRLTQSIMKNELCSICNVSV